MFDWNDQELANILWGEADDSDDHIVPYPCGSEETGDLIKKGWNEETANERPSNQKKPVPLSELNGVKEEKNSECNKNGVHSAAGYSVDSWNALSTSKMPKSCQDSMDEPAKLDSKSQIFQNSNDDKDSDLIGYGWDNIGSFEDLERIFSNGDPEFGCTSLGNADELWSSCKDIASSPEKCASLSMDFSSLGSQAPNTEHYGKTEDMLDQAQPFATGYDNVNDLTCCVPQNVRANMNHLRHAEFKNYLCVEDKIARDMVSKNLRVNSNLNTKNIAVPTKFSEKMNRQKNTLGTRKRSGEESGDGPFQDLPKTWFPLKKQFLQLEGQYAKTGQSRTFLGINQQIKHQEPASPPYNNVNTPLFSPGHTNMQIQNPVEPILQQFHSVFEVPPGKSTTLNKSPGSPANPLTMTPQEKIKKLRRRQQLRAMLAIQKQQRQFGHQTSESQHSICQKCTIVDQMQPIGGNLEVDNGISNILTLDANSPLEQDYSGKVSMVTDDCSVENAILYRLQDIVAKLDVQLRLCIRDSLCRLAQSATQRQYAKDTCSTMKSSGNYLEFLEETKTDNRSGSTPEAETDTNQIDRTVAHLLFHRPIEFSGNPETAESPSSTKLPLCAEVEMFKSSSCRNTSEYASNCEAVQEEVTEGETSH